jgi:hydroxymethylpyrimidine pyrophosphatase-like HAD family hydrolase
MTDIRYQALATDYDGTLASHGTVDQEKVAALQRLAATGRKLILVTGRQLEDLEHVFPEVAIFDRVVAENGPVLYAPNSGETRLLAQPPPAPFVDALRQRGVEPLFLGHVVVATLEPNDAIVREVIRELRLELQVILNKGSVMVLPMSVDKATGLAAVLHELSLSTQKVVAVGDAENDQTFLALCGRSVAVANALDAVKAEADYVVQGRSSAGVRELIDLLIADDLRSVDESLARKRIVF